MSIVKYEKKEYKCDICEREFVRKGHYIDHMNKKNPCKKPKKMDICDYCNEKYENMNEHLKDNSSVCFFNRAKMKDSEIKQLKSLEDKIEQHLEKLLPILCDNNMNLGKTVINNNLFKNSFKKKVVNKVDPAVPLKAIEFRKHGQERIDHITREMVLEIFKHKFSIVCIDLMTLIYFNPDVPENSIWSIAYPKNDEAAIVLNHDTEEFERMETELIIEDKFENMISLLFPLVNSIQNDLVLYPTLSEMQKGNLVRFLSHLGYRIATDSPFIYTVIHKLCYEQRRIPMRLWGECGYSGSHLSLKFK